jgi:fatty acid desaturase
MTARKELDPMASQDAVREVIVREQLVSCCEPFGHRASGVFWGTALVVIGGVWLVASAFGLQNWGEWLVPALFLVWGVALLTGGTHQRAHDA